MEIVNLTPHSISVGGRTYPPSGQVARLAEEERAKNPIPTSEGDIPLYQVIEGEVTGLPELDRYTIYVVSRPVAQAVRIPSVVAPHHLVRNAEGQVVGAEGLCYFGLRAQDIPTEG